MISRHERAELLSPDNAPSLLLGIPYSVRWLDDDRVIYQMATAEGQRHLACDAATGATQPLFDHDAVAAQLTRQTGHPCSASSLAVERTVVGEKALELTVDGVRWDWDSARGLLTERGPVAAPGVSRSPDGAWEVFVTEGNLQLREVESGTVRPLTSDAEPGIAWATPSDMAGPSAVMVATGMPQPVLVSWSQDASRFLTHRLDQRAVPRFDLTESCPTGGDRPAVHSLHYAMPGDPLPVATYHLFDVPSARRHDLNIHAEVPFMSPLQTDSCWWKDGTAFVILEERGKRAQRLIRIDGERVTQVLEERRDPYVEVTPLVGLPPLVRPLASGELIWWSERDGWGHLYLYGPDGTVTRQITSGSFQVREIVHVDESERTICFTAGGLVPGQNPYFRQLCRVGFDGQDLTVLSPEDADHQVSASPGGLRFLDTYAAPGQGPITVLRTVGEAEPVPVARADLSRLDALGFRHPEQFQAVGADGVTDIWGLLYLPTDFDPTRRYPIVDSMYPGPQIARQVRLEHFDPFLLDSFGAAASTAEMGLAVVVIDGRGTPLRSREMHEHSVGRIGDIGLDDHVAAITQLAATRPWLDTTRIGAYGHSGGGYAAARSLMLRPDVYRVAVSMSGNHDQADYFAAWGEQYHGDPANTSYDEQATKSLAARLVGKLLLIHGECDDNVPLAQTMALARELMANERDVDMLIVPGAAHGFGELEQYVGRRCRSYLVEHLIGEPDRGGR